LLAGDPMSGTGLATMGSESTARRRHGFFGILRLIDCLRNVAGNKERSAPWFKGRDRGDGVTRREWNIFSSS
jgi:hypothetical protein